MKDGSKSDTLDALEHVFQDFNITASRLAMHARSLVDQVYTFLEEIVAG